ncbi:MAG: hypothetical protein ACFFC7_02630 [Candidatus Hermodarchaeota archaeon]
MLVLDKYREVLKNHKPFEHTKSRYNSEELADVSGPYKFAKSAITRALAAALEDGSPRFSPLLGAKGSGKTHFYFHLKNIEKDENPQWMVIYIPPPEKEFIENVPFHIYKYILEQKGDLLLYLAADKIMNEYQRGGILRKPSIEELIRYVLRDYPGITADIVKSIFIYGYDRNRKQKAKRWLFGEDLTEEEMSILGVARSNLKDDDIVFSALKILTKYTDRMLILFFDDLQTVYMEQGYAAIGAYLEYIKRFYNELGNITCIGTCLTEKWDNVVKSLDDAMRGRLEPETEIKNFDLSDLEEFYLQRMNNFWIQHGLSIPEDQYYPLSKIIIRQVHQKSEGNPQKAIQFLQDKISSVS